MPAAVRLFITAYRIEPRSAILEVDALPLGQRGDSRGKRGGGGEGEEREGGKGHVPVRGKQFTSDSRRYGRLYITAFRIEPMSAHSRGGRLTTRPTGR